MDSESVKVLMKRLYDDEGYKECVYQDSLGYFTIGVGICVDKRVEGAGLQEEEINYILKNRINILHVELLNYSFYKNQKFPRQAALLNMAFNMGVGGLLGFKKMIKALENKDYEKAALEATRSRWAEQVQKSRVYFVYKTLKDGNLDD